MPTGGVGLGERTTLTKATSKSDSLRTTVPKGIVKHFGMAERDKLEWTLRVHGSKLTIEVSHVKKNVKNERNNNQAVRERRLAIKPVGTDRQDNPASKTRWRLR